MLRVLATAGLYTGFLIHLVVYSLEMLLTASSKPINYAFVVPDVKAGAIFVCLITLPSTLMLVLELPNPPGVFWAH